MSEGATNTVGDSTLPLRESVLGELPPRDTTALVRSVRDRLRLAIALGEIEAGSKLNQVQLAKQLGVSRMPIRTAVAELVAEGLLELIPGGGVAVSWLTVQDLRNVFEVRAALEASAVRRVAEARPVYGLNNIDRVVARHKPRVESYDAAQLLGADREFHMSILDATDNSYFGRAIVPVWSTVERAMVQILHLKDVFAHAWDEHEQIAEALRTGDADLAERCLRQHLEKAAAELEKVLSAKEGQQTTHFVD